MFIVKILEYVHYLFTSNSHLHSSPPQKKVIYPLIMGFSSGSTVENLPTVQETQQEMLPVQSLGREDPLEKEMATHSSILVWEIPWTEEPGRSQKSQTCFSN